MHKVDCARLQEQSIKQTWAYIIIDEDLVLLSACWLS